MKLKRYPARHNEFTVYWSRQDAAAWFSSLGPDEGGRGGWQNFWAGGEEEGPLHTRTRQTYGWPGESPRRYRGIMKQDQSPEQRRLVEFLRAYALEKIHPRPRENPLSFLPWLFK